MLTVVVAPPSEVRLPLSVAVVDAILDAPVELVTVGATDAGAAAVVIKDALVDAQADPAELVAMQR